MLSIIISSYQPDNFSALKKNIAETCGIDYEIVKIDNPGLMGICEAYNKGATLAKYDFLLFIHEDVLFETQNWGLTLINHLKNKGVGCVGLAGASYIPNVPCGWWMVDGYAYSHLAHLNKKTKTRHNYTFEGNQQGLLNVKFLDGVFISSKKSTWAKNKFDERLKTFHAYDISFSLQLNSRFKNYITNRIDIIHFSAGSLTKDWLEQLLLNRKINKSFFVEDKIDPEVEIKTYRLFAQNLKHKKFSKTDIFIYLSRFLNLRRLGAIGILKTLRIIYWSIK